MLLALLDPLRWILNAGGIVLVLILCVAICLFAISLERFFYWRLNYRQGRRRLIDDWVAKADHTSWSALTLRELATRDLIQGLRKPLPWMKLLVALCPLLGLLGTVTGMIHVFDSLALTEANQARAMSEGVSRATLPTLVGMAVAVVGLLFLTRLELVVRREDQRLHDRMARAVEDSNA